MKITILLFIAVILSVLYRCLFEYRPSVSMLNTLYSASSVLFSIGIGLVVAIIPNGIKNPFYIKKIRANLNRLRNCFLIEFLLVTFVHLFYDSCPIKNINIFSYTIILDPVMVDTMLLCLSFVYYFLNFIDIQKFNNDIFTETNKD